MRCSSSSCTRPTNCARARPHPGRLRRRRTGGRIFRPHRARARPHQRDPQAADPAARSPGDNDAARLPGLSRFPVSGVRLPVGAVSHDRDRARSLPGRAVELRRQAVRRHARRRRQSPRRRGRSRSEADRPARSVAVAHAVRAPARLRFLARIPQRGEAHARRRRGPRARECRDQPRAAGGRSWPHRRLAAGIPGDLRARLRSITVADVARRRAGGAVRRRLSRPAGAATAVPAAGGFDECRRAADVVAIPARAHGPAHDRREDRHWGIRGSRLSARHRRKPPHLLRPVPAVDLSYSALAAAQASARGRGRDGLQVHGGAERVTLDLREHFSEFRGADPARIHLAAHSHHFWPDAACRGHRRALEDAARLADKKWETVLGVLMPRVQRGIAAVLALPDPATIAVAPNTHDFFRRLLSALPAGTTLRILTSDSEFYSFTRQVARLEEDGLVAVERIAAEPFASFPQRFASAARRGGHDLVYVSQVFFNSAAISGPLDDIAGAVGDNDALVVFDGYHGFMAVPTALTVSAGRAFYLAGGYKYAMAGEGVCFMYCPPGFAMRPRDTGWFAAFGALGGKGDGSVAYGADGTRFMGATFDPTGLYRQAAVFDWMDEIGLTVGAIHDHVLALQNLFLAAVARAKVRPLADARLVTPIAVGIGRGHFLTFELSGAQALHDRLARANLVTDVRGERIRFGFGCYHTADEIERAVAAIARAVD